MKRAGLFAMTGALAAFTLAVPASGASSVSTVSAASTARQAVICNTPANTPGHSAARLRAGAAQRGIKEPNQVTAAQASKIEQEFNTIVAQQGAATGFTTFRAATVTPTIYIPVYFHVIYAGTQGRVATSTIQRQVQVLNDTFGGKTGGAVTHFRFYLNGEDWTNNAKWYNDPFTYEAAYKKKLHKGASRSLNIYTANLGDVQLGWTTYPWQYKHAPHYMDGVVVHRGSLVGGSIANYNLGYSATHETGHWLGLYHTFEGYDEISAQTGGCSGKGDRVADTPAEAVPSEGCKIGVDTCPSPGVDPIHNFMDYSYDTCMNQFTAGQATRMHQEWTAYRG